MKKTTTNRSFTKIGAVLVLTAFWIMLPFLMNGSVVEAGDADSDIRIQASLSGAAIGGVSPSGFAEHRLDDSGRRRLSVQTSSVNLPNGTVLDIYVNNAFVGQIAINNGVGFFNIDTNNGQSVPNVSNGNPIAVRQGATNILTGTFGIVSASPSPSVSPSGSPNPSPSASPNPSPSASPTGSPNPSPSASPTGSPNPSPSASPTGSPNPSPSASPTGSPNPSPSPNAGDLFAVLSGATVNGVLPNGFAQYEIHDSRRELEIEVNQVNLPAGTQLSVTVDNVAVGQLFLESDGRGKLRLRTDNGQFVPVVVSGSTIVLRNGGTTILSGVFGGGANPSPSPSASPSASPSGSPSPNPTASPSASPSPSPSPSLGRAFEARVTGSQMIPPVTTSATGQIKVLLNQTETQATITGSFQNLSSAQTTARIFLTAGDTSILQNLGTIGGTSGNFASITIPVNALQVAQIRTGLWFAVIGTVNNPNGEVGGRFTTQSTSSDFDGDGSNDFAVFRPSNGVWYTQNSQGFSGQVLGNANDKLVSGDYDGDGRTDAAVFRNVNGLGIWEIKRSSDGGITSAQFGYATDAAVRGDFDGDGRNDLAVYRSSNGTWYIQRSGSSGFIGVRFGASEDKPVAADFDGDGKTDIAVFRPSNGVWYWIRSVDGAVGASQWGQVGDVPIAGDFDGDGKADVSVFRPSNGVWYTQRSSNGTYDFRQFGASDDIPVAGNYDGDNKTDIAVFRPSNGVWYILRSVDGTYDYRLFGQNGDIPTPVR